MKKVIIPGFAIAYHSSYENWSDDGTRRLGGGGEITFGPKMIQADKLPPELEKMIEQFLGPYEVKRRGLNPDTTQIVLGISPAESTPEPAATVITSPKFQPGDKVALTGLIDHTYDNGRVVTIKAHCSLEPNQYCPSGHGYYVEEHLNWTDYVYEERLSHANS